MHKFERDDQIAARRAALEAETPGVTALFDQAQIRPNVNGDYEEAVLGRMRVAMSDTGPLTEGATDDEAFDHRVAVLERYYDLAMQDIANDNLTMLGQASAGKLEDLKAVALDNEMFKGDPEEDAMAAEWAQGELDRDLHEFFGAHAAGATIADLTDTEMVS